MTLDVQFFRGTEADYEALKTKDDHCFYYTTDKKHLYIGDTQLANEKDLQAAITRLTTVEGQIDAIEDGLNQLLDMETVSVTDTHQAEYYASWEIKQGNVLRGTILIPKDVYINSAKIVTLTADNVGETGKYSEQNVEPGVYLQIQRENNPQLILTPLKDILKVATDATEVKLDFDTKTNTLSASLVDGGVTTSKLADGSVTMSKIKDSNVTKDKLAGGAVTNIALAENSISTGKIRDGAVTEPKLADNAVTTPKIADSAVTEQKLADNAVTEKKIKDSAVTESKLAKDSVTTEKIKNGNVTADKLAANSVTTEKIQDGNVTREKLSEELRTELDKDRNAIGNLQDLTTDAKDNLVSAINEVDKNVNDLVESSKVTVTEETSGTGEFAKVYDVRQGNSSVGKINIPKDLVVQSAEVVEITEDQLEELTGKVSEAGTYIVLTIANATNDKIYVNVGKLVDIYTAEESATEIQVKVDNTSNVISATIVAGSITKEKLNSALSGEIDTATSTSKEAKSTAETAKETAENAKTAAEAAQKAAEDAAKQTADKVEAAQQAAEQAAERAETAQHSAESSASQATEQAELAGDAQEGATAAKEAAEAAQAEAKKSADAAEESELGAVAAETEAKNAKQDALDAQAAAEAAQAAAEKARDEAKVADEDAKTQASNAAQSAASAETAKGEAETAKDAAVEAQTAAETAKNGAETSATAAAGSAEAASQSAEQAAASAETAEQHDQAAADSASQAGEAAERADGSADAADASATKAQGAAETATQQATEAAESADSAQSAADQAEASQAEATKQAGAAQKSAETAKTQADAAASSASDAAGAASDAAESEVAALEAAQQAKDAQTAAEKAKTDAQNIADNATQAANEAKSTAEQANQTAESAKQAADEADKKVDQALAGLSGAMHFKGTVSQIPPNDTEEYKSGDVVVFTSDKKEYVYDGTSWRELGDESSYVLKTQKVNNHPLSGDITLTASDVGAVAKSGDTMTGDLIFSGNKRSIKFASGLMTYPSINFFQGTADGSGMTINGGGRTIIGGGESATTFHDALAAGKITVPEGGITGDNSEQMHITSDKDVYIFTNIQPDQNSMDAVEPKYKVFKFGTDGNLSEMVGGSVFTSLTSQDYTELENLLNGISEVAKV